MPSNFQALKDQDLIPNLFKGKFGLEIEGHRVETNLKRLSRLKHPTTLGDRKTNFHFQTDFAETQEELVTNPNLNPQLALAQLKNLQKTLCNHLQDSEIIWPLSMPPHLTNNDLHFLKNNFHRPWYQEYWDISWQKYNPFQLIMTGVHVSHSIDEKLITWYHQQHPQQSYATAKNHLFFQVAQQIVGYRWFLTYLFGATPVSENKNDTIPQKIRNQQPVRSLRASQYGFNNLPNIKVDYANFDDFIKQINYHVQNKDLYGQREFYGSVRLRGTDSLNDLVVNGAKYLEFRNFDTDPFSNNGIKLTTLHFLQLLIIDAILNPQPWSQAKLNQAQTFNHEVALQKPNQALNPILKKAAAKILTRLDNISQLAPKFLKSNFKNVIQMTKKTLDQPQYTIAGQLSPYIKANSLMDFGLQQGQKIKMELQNTTA